MKRIAAAAFLAVTDLGTQADAQCEQWLDAPGQSDWQVRDFASLGARIALIARYSVQVQLPPPGGGMITVPRSRVYAFDGNEITNLGGEFGGSLIPGNAFALKSYAQTAFPFGQELICGGAFPVVGGVSASNIARWVESSIAFPPPAWEPMGAGFNGEVHAVERFNGATYAGGLFTASGATVVSRIARWTGSAWEPVGSGPGNGLNGPVYALRTGAVAPNAIELLAGGDFTSAGGTTANRIARWVVNPIVPGSGAWSAMGQGFNGAVLAIERHGNSIYAAGNFTMSGATPVNRVARWNGSAWVDVGGGFNAYVRTLLSSGGFLYAGGGFASAGGGTAAAQRIARWDGVAWSQVLHGATGGAVWALHPFQTEIHAGGEFSSIGNLPGSVAWARYNPTGTPWIALQPQSISIECGANADFLADVALGYTGLDYRWRKDGVPLTNGPTGTGSSIANASGLTSFSFNLPLSISNASGADQGVYDYVVSSACGQATSTGATLTVTGCCYPDCNESGGLTVADFICFQSKFVAGCP